MAQNGDCADVDDDLSAKYGIKFLLIWNEEWKMENTFVDSMGVG